MLPSRRQGSIPESASAGQFSQQPAGPWHSGPLSSAALLPWPCDSHSALERWHTHSGQGLLQPVARENDISYICPLVFNAVLLHGLPGADIDRSDRAQQRFLPQCSNSLSSVNAFLTFLFANREKLNPWSNPCNHERGFFLLLDRISHKSFLE